ncbi:exosortase-dependent surface protein XDP2 [Brunnivagina elsteri]|uniref:PEP-CTERM sorting domain-containing protein n=1 Tax=Brunnivagina elsteri CCALA 953 TaxID=987040 RepID=A0A2A2THG0_9CYAN|nr:exosortase-dependent surface protein XDP2 [Calothrix elsteri]PAX53184.1 PEP-CTERM sorting domain-containing protein [Calothrix elsteri CCALA 953]
MKLTNLIASISLVIGSVVVASNSAQAASFTSNVNQKTDAKADILLQSITQNGTTFKDFTYVSEVKALINTARTATNANSGAASTDRGDNATSPVSASEDPNRDDLEKFLGNNNLNNIVDTEDSGTFKMDLIFKNAIFGNSQGTDSLFFWERGMNSDLLIQGFDQTGKLIGNSLKLLRGEQSSAGFKIDTTEIGSAQDVGNWGVSLQQLGVTSLSGIRVISEGKAFNGPDFKLIARTGESKSVPEPGMVLSVGALAGVAFLRRRQSNQSSAI